MLLSCSIIFFQIELFYYESLEGQFLKKRKKNISLLRDISFSRYYELIISLLRVSYLVIISLLNYLVLTRFFFSFLKVDLLCFRNFKQKYKLGEKFFLRKMKIFLIPVE